ncbi:hypothetical protein OKW34_000074 [Paraburkholderia youngii]|uniref:hypothetical protein n=1 Tax=Paraburkholderia youngii TaxID=2782701 RepID=UPI003D1C280E
MSLYAESTLLRVLFGATGELSPWRVFDRGDAGTVAFNVPAVRNVSVREAEFPSIRCFAIDSNVRLVTDERGAWTHGEWAYAALARFVMDTALERELLQPGYAKATIPFVREALNNALPLPPETRITISRAACKEQQIAGFGLLQLTDFSRHS